MADVITRFKIETTQFDSKLRDASKELADIGKKAAEAGKGFDGFTKESLDAAKALGSIGTSANNTKDKVKELVGAYNDVARTWDKLTEDQKQSDFGKAMAGSLQQLQTRITAAKQELYGLDDAVNKVKSNSGSLKQLFGGIAGKFGMSPMMFTGVGAAVAGVGALTAAMKQNIETAKGFEKSMSGLSALTGMVGNDLDVLKEYAIELGSKTTLTASQVADAFKLIGSQQPQLLSSASALKEVTQYAIRLSEAAGIDLATASQTLSASINQMGGDSNNAARYVNVLAAASQKGAGDIAWLGESITKSATAAKAVGTDYEELVANLEQLAKAGFDASTAGTALRSIIMKLEKQTNDEFKPSVVGLTQAFENMAKAELTITDYQKTAGTMFATQAKVLAENAAAARELTDAITGTNIAEEQASTNTANLDGALKSLGSAWEGLNLHINSSNGFLKSTVDWLKEVVTWADQTFTAAGKAQRRLAELQGGGNGEPTKVESQVQGVQSLGGDRAAQLREIYRIESEYQQWINNLNAAIANGGKMPGAGSGEGRDVRSLKLDLEAAQRMYDEFENKIKSTLNPSAGASSSPVTIEVDANTEPAEEKLSDLKAKLKELRAMRDEAINEGDFASRDDYNAQIKEVQNRIKELQGTAKINVEPEPGSIAAMEQYIKKLRNDFKNTADEGVRRELSEALLYAEKILNRMEGKLSKTGGYLFRPSTESGYNVKVTADTTEALEQLRGIDGIIINEKDFTVTAYTDEALEKLKEIDGLEIDDKDISINYNVKSLAEHLGLENLLDGKIEGLDKIKIDPKTLKITTDLAAAGDAAKASWSDAMSAINGVGSALAGIEDPAVKVLGIIAEAIATIALTFAKSLKGTFTPWDWIAGAAAGTATMISTIAAIKSATSGFAGGGIVPGNSFSGDNIAGVTPSGDVFGLNSGELVLNRAQVGVLGSSLQEQASQNRQVLVTKVKGTDLIVMLDRTGKMTGKGELMFWK